MISIRKNVNWSCKTSALLPQLSKVIKMENSFMMEWDNFAQEKKLDCKNGHTFCLETKIVILLKYDSDCINVEFGRCEFKI